jgi:hypothetical protein
VHKQDSLLVLAKASNGEDLGGLKRFQIILMGDFSALYESKLLTWVGAGWSA